MAHVQQVKHFTSNGPATVPHQRQLVTPRPALWTPVQPLFVTHMSEAETPFLAWLTTSYNDFFCLTSLLVGESTVETLRWTSHRYCAHQKLSEDSHGQIKPRCRKSKQPQLSTELHRGGGQTEAHHTNNKWLHLPVWFSVLKNPQAFPTNMAPTPLELTPTWLCFYVLLSQGKTLHASMYVDVHMFVYAWAVNPRIMHRSTRLFEFSVKCVTLNLSLPFGFHIMHYQQWLFSTQVPFRKLSSEKGTRIKEIERDNVSDAWQVLQLPQNARECVLWGARTESVCHQPRIKALHGWREWSLEASTITWICTSPHLAPSGSLRNKTGWANPQRCPF